MNPKKQQQNAVVYLQKKAKITMRKASKEFEPSVVKDGWDGISLQNMMGDDEYQNFNFNDDHDEIIFHMFDTDKNNTIFDMHFVDLLRWTFVYTQLVQYEYQRLGNKQLGENLHYIASGKNPFLLS